MDFHHYKMRFNTKEEFEELILPQPVLTECKEHERIE